jgi:DNA-binding transcriptional ArsR family regulator
MFNSMVEETVKLDRVYRALGDRTRRGMLDALRGGEARITDLAAPLPISFAAVARHVAVLEDAELIARDVRGREHWLSVRGESLTGAEAWLAAQTAFWTAAADALAAHVERDGA